MSPFSAEIIGTMLLILIGNGVVANITLDKTKGNNGGYLLVNLAWGLAVYVGVVVAGPYSGAHLNPAVTIGLAIAGKFAWTQVGGYILAQSIGAALGSILVLMMYRDHYLATDDDGGKLGTFATSAEIRNPITNLMSEVIGTFVLLIGVFFITNPTFEMADGANAIMGLGSVGALPISLFVMAIGMSLGGTTGYAINPVRDIVPRFMHGILPIGKRGKSDWGYAWIPAIGPILGAAVAAGLYIVVV
ncbi:aquaporin family protein [Saprospiraceae bacterium]|nr:aquaporin family protein [Saprospiraceae bacterium]